MTDEIVSISGVDVRIDPSWSEVMKKAFRDKNYEVAEIRMLDKIHPVDVVMELGTGIGVVASYLNKVRRVASIHTYEINQDLKPFIDDTRARNGAQFRSHLYTLNWTPGSMEFYPHNDFWATSEKYQTLGSQEKRYANVIDFKEECELICPDVLIVDIEGGEYELLAANPSPLPKCIHTVIVEMHPNIISQIQIQAIKTRLGAQGFLVIGHERDVYHYHRYSNYPPSR